MGFQQTVNNNMGFGVPGDSFLKGPHRALSWILESGSEPNVIGSTAYTYVSDGVAQAGGTTAFVGILTNSKVYPTAGTNAGALAPTMTLPNGITGELCTMHTGLVVQLTNNTAAVGDVLIYNNTTGALTSQAPGASVPSGSTLIVGSKVVAFAVGNGLAVVELNG